RGQRSVHAVGGGAMRRLSMIVLGGPAFLADQRHEANVGDVLGLVPVGRGADNANQFLDAPILADRNDQPASNLELRLQRRRYFGAAGRDDNRIVRRVVGPAERSVAVQYMHVAITQVGKRGSGFFGKLADALYRVDAARDAREDRRGVAGTGADL